MEVEEFSEHLSKFLGKIVNPGVKIRMEYFCRHWPDKLHVFRFYPEYIYFDITPSQDLSKADLINAKTDLLISLRRNGWLKREYDMGAVYRNLSYQSGQIAFARHVLMSISAGRLSKKATQKIDLPEMLRAFEASFDEIDPSWLE